ncbi:MAG: 16S rRNA (guanine(966)-N(2))-methyltransferase RsmD [Thiotrichales bacterium]|nr:16S rRNA (guanine(966)-N(2))-methyltransferase RsmD [Thiotrichales bacterium]
MTQSINRHLAKSLPRGKGEIRMIGGDWRGRKLPVRMAEGLRPTSDRIRETLFNWLQFEVAGARVLDLFAGSGALGFEALSRGAQSAVFLEKSQENAQQLQRNLQYLATSKGLVVQTDSLQWLKRNAEQTFDLVFLDPPFHQSLMQLSLNLLFEYNWLNPQGAWFYLEQEKTLPWPNLPSDCRLHREKTTSQARCGLFHYVKQVEDGALT